MAHHADCTAREATKFSKAIEERARQAAVSLEDYHQRCQREVELLRRSLIGQSPASDVQNDHGPGEHPQGGTTLGQYTNAQHFRDGLFSEVFKAIHADASQEAKPSLVFALKVTTPSIMHPPHDSEREARILRNAESAHVIHLVETFQQPGGRFILVFPYMAYDLETLLQRDQLSSVAQRSILQNLAAGLVHIHSLGIIHRDIKPSNILLSSPNGPAYIADFGIAWSPSDAASEPSDSKILDVGTTCYRPPEILFGYASYDTKLDLWATGCVVAQIVSLHGATLFDAGALGSELALIKSIFETLGTPDENTWPETSKLPDWGKMNFYKYPGKSWKQILPDAESSAIDLVSRLVVYESSHRLSAEGILNHPYLHSDHT